MSNPKFGPCAIAGFYRLIMFLNEATDSRFLCTIRIVSGSKFLCDELLLSTMLRTSIGLRIDYGGFGISYY
jgi:hypothetical protein